jgi:hypothetical protein
MRTNLRSPLLLMAMALALGVAADALFYRRLPGISLPIFVALCLATLALQSRAEQRSPTWANLWLGAGAVLFAGFLALRSEGMLTFLNVCACLGLLLLQVGLFRDAPLAGMPGYQYGLRALLALGEISLRPAGLTIEAAGRALQSAEGMHRYVPVGRGMLLAAPVVGVFTMLLMAADSVFASYVLQVTRLGIRFDLVVQHGILVGFVSWICAGALVTALRQPITLSAPAASEGDTQRLGQAARPAWRLGWVEATTVIAAVDLLFLSFAIIQTAYFFGGLDTLARTGMTFADYARRGFFELVVVACLALGMLWLLAAITRRDTRGQLLAFNGACAALIVLVLALLGSAFFRMWLYEQAYGFTHLRLYTHSFMIWLAALLLLFLAALLRNRPRWFSFGGLVSALALLAALNVANPEGLIVQANVTRYVQTGSLAVNDDFDLEPSYRSSRALDAAYLARLSPDATPALVAALPRLDADSQQVIVDSLRRQREWLDTVAMQDGWPAFHLGRAWARAALNVGL